ncbi:hydrogenase (NiFe) small subunit HydA [Desulfarculus baarsii DSM 2075]|uniref:Hydrogenase (NiFe) small subunit HydA n=1 Tax=Desulfarculus baarsii (strain ATCC 33931 / DSM 2075 / LMG 7858 / VKM B-1802 / 2st14) TaxID=644282 RepID=E1QFN1_DESB2|nr:hydrogenase small subunit [Desulfarculus baarsii]ADK84367.1 hydrogenase (NiFe) small subunit HydA [Desulfarculus baarsii DSM 2075]
MASITRRQFLKFGATLAAVMGLEPSLAPSLAQALARMEAGQAPVLWLQGQSCSGCSVSFLNSEAPSPARVITRYISLLFHSTLSAATGQTAMDTVDKAIDAGGYLLVVEGSLPAGMPEACVMGHRPVTDLVKAAAAKAKAVVALGSCAAFGGIPAAQNNPTGAVGVAEFLEAQGVKTPLINLPGCPTHPDWLVGTLAHLLQWGLPPLDALKRPKAFYGRILHDQCPRFADYERENFAKTFGEPGCLFKLGCLGPITHADCTVRFWNGGVNTCIAAGAPCIGCASEGFARSAELPFYRKTELARGKGGRN